MSRPPGEPSFDPQAYRRWFETPLGSRVDRDEKDVVFALAGLRPGERVLDLGCGDGNYTLPAAERAGLAVGLDRSLAMLAAARQRLESANAVLVRGDAIALPFPDASFDAVIAVTVLCFAANPENLLREARRVLRPGGRLVAGELGRRSAWALARRTQGLFRPTVYRHARFFTPRELFALLQRAGFIGVSWRGAVFYPPFSWPPALAVARHLEPAGRRFFPWAAAFMVVRGERAADSAASRIPG